MDSTIDLPLIQEIDPILDIEKAGEQPYAIENGGTNVSFVISNADSINYNSQSSIQVQVNPTGFQNICDPIIWVRAVFTCTATGSVTSGFPSLLAYGFDAPRAYPFNQVINTTKMDLNSSAFTENTSTFFTAMIPNLSGDDVSAKESSQCPNMPDQFQEYSLGLGKSNNPLDVYGNGYQMSRGGFSNFSIISNATSGTMTLDCQCPIYLSPLYFAPRGFTSIKTLYFTFTLGNLNRAWSCTENNTNTTPALNRSFTSFSTILNTVEIRSKWITPKGKQYGIPKTLYYPWFNMNQTTNTAPNIAPGTSYQIQTSSQNLSTIPKRIMIYVRESDQYRTQFSSDTFAQINQIILTYGDKQTVLSNASASDFFKMSRDEGYKMSFAQFNLYTGSVLMLNTTKLGLMSEETAPSVQGENPIFSVQVTFTNTSYRTINYTAFCMIFYEGCMIQDTDSGNIEQKVNVISKQNVLKSLASPVRFDEPKISNIYGGKMRSLQHGGAGLPYKDILKLLANLGIDGVNMLLGGSKNKKNEEDEKTIEYKIDEEKFGGKIIDKQTLKSKLLEGGSKYKINTKKTYILKDIN